MDDATSGGGVRGVVRRVACGARDGLRSTDAPLLWGLTGTIVPAAFAAGIAAAATGAAPTAGAATAAGLMGMFVLLAGLLVPPERSLAATLGVCGATLIALLLAWVSADRAVVSGVGMAVVMGAAVLAGRRGPALGALGSLLSSAYFLFALLGVAREIAIGRLMLVGLVGAVVAMAILVGLHLLRRLTGWRPVPAVPARPKTPIARLPLFADGRDLRYAIVRGVLLGGGMGVYTATGNHNAFWVLLTLYVVLQPTPDALWRKALRRVVGVMVGCLLIAALAPVVDRDVLIGISLAALVIGFAYYRRNYAIYAACISFVVVAGYGAVDGGTAHWALYRAIDTTIGAAVGITAMALALAVPGWRSTAAPR